MSPQGSQCVAYNEVPNHRSQQGGQVSAPRLPTFVLWLARKMPFRLTVDFAKNRPPSGRPPRPIKAKALIETVPSETDIGHEILHDKLADRAADVKQRLDPFASNHCDQKNAIVIHFFRLSRSAHAAGRDSNSDRSPVASMDSLSGPRVFQGPLTGNFDANVRFRFAARVHDCIVRAGRSRTDSPNHNIRSVHASRTLRFGSAGRRESALKFRTYRETRARSCFNEVTDHHRITVGHR